MKRIFALLLLAACVSACSENQKENEGSDSTKSGSREDNPLTNEDDNYASPTSFDKDLHPYTDFTYLPGKGGEFATERGTKITIPKHTFAYKDGKPVMDPVTIKYKEFHTPGEIILSGIPMEYDSAGVKKTFQSAGMFEIRAFVDGIEVDIANGKKVSVDLASNMDGNFNFYQLDESNQNWKTVATSLNPEKNGERSRKLDSLGKQKIALKKPNAPNPYKPGDKLFDIYINTKFFPQYAALNGLMWKYVGTEKENDPALNKNFAATEWQVVYIEPQKDDKYMIRFEKGKDTFSLLAQPIFQGALLTRENKKFKQMLENFNADYNRIANEEKRTQAEMALLRKFDLTSMGIYNYDRYYKNPDVILVDAEFDFKQEINLRANPVSVFLVPKGENAVIKYVPETYDKFSFNPKLHNTLIAILPDKTICSYSNEGFKKIKYDPDKKAQRFMFSMKNEENEIKGPKDIDQILAASK